jgi:hypothetical protein
MGRGEAVVMFYGKHRSQLKFGHWGFSPFEVDRFVEQYWRIHNNPSAQALLSPYYTARFAQP